MGRSLQLQNNHTPCAKILNNFDYSTVLFSLQYGEMPKLLLVDGSILIQKGVSITRVENLAARHSMMLMEVFHIKDAFASLVRAIEVKVMRYSLT